MSDFEYEEEAHIGLMVDIMKTLDKYILPMHRHFNYGFLRL